MKLGKSIDDGDTIGEKGLEFSRFPQVKSSALLYFVTFRDAVLKPKW